MPAPPYSSGTEMPSSPSLAMPPRTRSRIEAMRAIESLICGRDFARAPLAHRLLEQLLFVGQIEVDHR